MNLNSEAIKKNDVEIAINNVSVVFKDNQGNDVKALDNIDFDIHKGEFISLLGPSGCGKTTLLRTIADLLEPTSGNVRVSNMTPKEIRLMQKFGIVFQNPVLFEWRTVKKNIELPERLVGIKKCTNPRCITSTEQGIQHIFKLTDRAHRIYRCIYCEADK